MKAASSFLWELRVSKSVIGMPADDLYRRWQGFIERIYKETVYIFTSRHKFREVEKLFVENPSLHETGGDVYEWLFGMWGRDALMGIRRELDGVQTNLPGIS